MSRNPYTPPEAAVGERPASAPTPVQLVRGGWLTTLLAIMTVANVLTALVYSLVVLGVLALPGRAPWVGQALLFLVGTNVICLIALWHWRKWGLYGLGGTALVTFVLNLSLGHTFSGAAPGLIGFALITATVSFKWKCFRQMSRLSKLRAIKIAHTLAWAFLAGGIVMQPLMAWRGNFLASGILITAVLVEVGVLLANRFRCPLTDLAARYTDDRRDNFDIYLPLWLARHNKQIFGTLFIAGIVFTCAMWRWA